MKYVLERIKYTNLYHTQDGNIIRIIPCVSGQMAGKLFAAFMNTEDPGTDFLVEHPAYLNRITFVSTSHMEKDMIVYDEVYIDTSIEFSEQAVLYNKLRSAIFHLTGHRNYLGYTYDERPNGWIVPYFSKRTAMKICKDCYMVYQDGGEYHCYYDADRDLFLSTDDRNGDEQPAVIGCPVTVELKGNPVTLYNFGVSGWIWIEKRFVI